MNHMEQVAKMLGVELGERFKVMRQGAISSSEFCITENGLYEKFRDQSSVINSPVLKNLLIGDAEIVKIPWKPKYWDDVWSVNTSGTPYEFTFNNSSNTHLALYKLDKLYHTREEAEAHAEEDKAYWNEIRKELEE